MNEKMSAEAFRESLDRHLAGLKGDPRLAQRIMAAEKGEVRVKKRFLKTAVLALAAVTVGIGAAIAEAAGINVFEFFGKTSARYAQLAPYAVLDEVSEVSVTTVSLGETAACISSAYYDGQTLLVGYTMKNASRTEAFTPDEALLGKMTSVPADTVWAADNDAQAAWLARFEQAKAEGTPMGIVSYTVYPSDHTLTEDGFDIEPRTEADRPGEDGVLYAIREYAFPLDPAIQDLERLQISIALYQSADYLYFDGEKTLAYHDSRPLPPMQAAIWNAHAQTQVYEGAGEIDGTALDASVRASAASALLEIRFSGEGLPPVPDLDHWYVFRLTDENGRALRDNGFDSGGQKEVMITYEGTGKLPEKMYLTIYLEHEGDFDTEKALRDAQPIQLTVRR